MALTSTLDTDNLEICARLGFYAVWIGSFVPTFRDKLSVPFSRIKQSLQGTSSPFTPEDATGSLSRNVVNKLPLCAAQNPNRAQILLAPRRKTQSHTHMVFDTDGVDMTQRLNKRYLMICGRRI